MLSNQPSSLPVLDHHGNPSPHLPFGLDVVCLGTGAGSSTTVYGTRSPDLLEAEKQCCASYVVTINGAPLLLFGAGFGVVEEYLKVFGVNGTGNPAESASNTLLPKNIYIPSNRSHYAAELPTLLMIERGKQQRIFDHYDRNEDDTTDDESSDEEEEDIPDNELLRGQNNNKKAVERKPPLKKNPLINIIAEDKVCDALEEHRLAEVRDLLSHRTAADGSRRKVAKKNVIHGNLCHFMPLSSIDRRDVMISNNSPKNETISLVSEGALTPILFLAEPLNLYDEGSYMGEKQNKVRDQQKRYDDASIPLDVRAQIIQSLEQRRKKYISFKNRYCKETGSAVCPYSFEAVMSKTNVLFASCFQTQSCIEQSYGLTIWYERTAVIDTKCTGLPKKRKLKSKKRSRNLELARFEEEARDKIQGQPPDEFVIVERHPVLTIVGDGMYSDDFMDSLVVSSYYSHQYYMSKHHEYLLRQSYDVSKYSSDPLHFPKPIKIYSTDEVFIIPCVREDDTTSVKDSDRDESPGIVKPKSNIRDAVLKMYRRLLLIGHNPISENPPPSAFFSAVVTEVPRSFSRDGSLLHPDALRSPSPNYLPDTTKQISSVIRQHTGTKTIKEASLLRTESKRDTFTDSSLNCWLYWFKKGLCELSVKSNSINSDFVQFLPPRIYLGHHGVTETVQYPPSGSSPISSLFQVPPEGIDDLGTSLLLSGSFIPVTHSMYMVKENINTYSPYNNERGLIADPGIDAGKYQNRNSDLSSSRYSGGQPKQSGNHTPNPNPRNQEVQLYMKRSNTGKDNKFSEYHYQPNTTPSSIDCSSDKVVTINTKFRAPIVVPVPSDNSHIAKNRSLKIVTTSSSGTPHQESSRKISQHDVLKDHRVTVQRSVDRSGLVVDTRDYSPVPSDVPSAPKRVFFYNNELPEARPVLMIIPPSLDFSKLLERLAETLSFSGGVDKLFTVSLGQPTPASVDRYDSSSSEDDTPKSSKTSKPSNLYGTLISKDITCLSDISLECSIIVTQKGGKPFRLTHLPMLLKVKEEVPIRSPEGTRFLPDGTMPTKPRPSPLRSSISPEPYRSVSDPDYRADESCHPNAVLRQLTNDTEPKYSNKDNRYLGGNSETRRQVDYHTIDNSSTVNTHTGDLSFQRSQNQNIYEDRASGYNSNVPLYYYESDVQVSFDTSHHSGHYPGDSDIYHSKPTYPNDHRVGEDTSNKGNNEPTGDGDKTTGNNTIELWLSPPSSRFSIQLNPVISF